MNEIDDKTIRAGYAFVYTPFNAIDLLLKRVATEAGTTPEKLKRNKSADVRAWRYAVILLLVELRVEVKVIAHTFGLTKEAVYLLMRNPTNRAALNTEVRNIHELTDYSEILPKRRCGAER